MRWRVTALGFLGGIAALLRATVVFAGNELIQRNQIELLEPISGGNTIPIGPGVDTWINYFNSAFSWLYDIAVGICILWLLYGGIQIMISSDQADKRAAGKSKMTGAIIGIVVLSFAGTILRMLNNLFFV